MATILKRPSGSYQAQVCVNGKRRAKSFTKLSDARRWVALIEQDLLNGEDPASSLPTSKFIKDYLDTVGARLKNHKCLSEILGFISETQLGDIPLRSVSKKHIEAWIEHRRTVPSRTTGALVKESTIARQFQMLSGFFSWAVQKELLKENPCHGVRKPKDSQPRERVATDDEIERIKHVAGWVEGTPPKTKTQRVAAAFVLSCFTGMRAGEILKLERQWINGNTITLPAEATKTASTRTIALCDRAKAILECVMSLGLEPEIFGLSDFVRDALWRKIRDGANLRNVYDDRGRLIKQGLTFHDGRATFATWAASPGPDGSPRLDVMSLARQTGHKNLKMLMRYYRPDVESFTDRLNQ